MTDTKHYGPVEWSNSVREQACKVAADNNDKIATESVVRTWVDNFDSVSDAFRASHERLISRVVEGA